jgi:predicted ferric reductase
MLFVLFAPLLASLGAGGTGDLTLELSLSFAILAASAMTCTIVAASRMRSLTKAFGIEELLRSHRWLALATLGLVLAHIGFLIVDAPANARLLVPWLAPPRAQAATVATVALCLLCVLSLFRHRLGTRYEAWRWLHVVLGLAAVTGAALHVLWLHHLTQDLLMLRWFELSLGLLVAMLGYRWLVRPVLATRNAYVIDSLRRESKSVSTLVLRPLRNRHRGLRFDPGQFAWLRLDRPLAPAEEHPFTIASGAHRPRELEFTIRAAGDFTGLVARLTPGRRVYLDGPHGAFTVDARSSTGLVLVAGGVGVTPMMSMLRTLDHRRDRRRHLLILAARTREELLFRDEIGGLSARLRLTVVEVLSSPPPRWTGETGRVDRALLSRVVPRQMRMGGYDVFICGPPAMVEGVSTALADLGVPTNRVHTEQFDMV